MWGQQHKQQIKRCPIASFTRVNFKIRAPQVRVLDSNGDMVGVMPTDQAQLTLLDQRAAARAAKNWVESDRLRDEIAALGWLVKDSKAGQSVTRKKVSAFWLSA